MSHCLVEFRSSRIARLRPVGLVLSAFACAFLLTISSGKSATTLEFAPALQGADEDEFHIDVPISRKGNLEGFTNVRYFTAPGDVTTLAGLATPSVDYIEVAGTLQFAPGESLKVVRIPIIYDAEVEMNGESFELRLAEPIGAEIEGSVSRGLYIVNSDPPPHAFDVDVSEGLGEAVVRVARGGRTGALPAITLPFETRNGSAFAGKDYLGVTNHVRFAENEQESYVHIALLDNPAVEPTKLFFFDLTQPGGSVATTRIRILNDDPGFLLLLRKGGVIDLAGNLLPSHTYTLETSADLKSWHPLQSAFEQRGYVQFIIPWPQPGPKGFLRVRE